MNTLEIKKKDTSWQFISNQIPFDISPIVEEVKNFSYQWDLDTSRQDNNKTHSGTRMYSLRYIDYSWIESVTPTWYDTNKLENEDLKNKIFNHLEDIYLGKVVRAEIVEMPGSHDIRTHVDGGTFLNIARRIHIPLITNENVFFTVFNKTINMSVGSWYEINNILPHSVKNNSPSKRIHMILDILPNKYF